MQELEFNNIYSITAHSKGNIVLNEDGESDNQVFDSNDWEVTVILTRKNNYIPGWYVDRSDLENPTTGNDSSWGASISGIVSHLTYYTQQELNDGEVPDEDMIRVKVVPYDEA